MKKYDIDCYIDRIIPHLQKIFGVKEGKFGKEYFKNIFQKNMN